VEILFQKINCGLFAARKVFRQKTVPKIPWKKDRTQSFPPEDSTQDSMESLLKSKPTSPTKCTFNGADASAFYR
jgi:hypothetical protein